MSLQSAALGCLMIGAGICSALAQEIVEIEGCPASGVEAHCLVLRGHDNVDYDISGAEPKPSVGRVVRLRGTKSGKLGVCQQGIILDDIQWSYTEGKCR